MMGTSAAVTGEDIQGGKGEKAGMAERCLLTSCSSNSRLSSLHREHRKALTGLSVHCSRTQNGNQAGESYSCSAANKAS